MSDDRSDGDPGEPQADVIDLAARGRFKPDVGKLACRRLASARQRLGWTRAQLAVALDEMVSWTVSAEIVESWETGAIPPGDVLIAVDLLVQRGMADPPSESSGSVGANVLDDLISDRFGDLVEVFPSRAAFLSALPPHALFDRATDISIAGLSLNLVCQQYSGQRLRRLIEGGSRMRCLFLAPHG
ncbi:MAG: DUF5919 domain-containing protein, partial [Actinomycetota bacterium]